MKKGRQEKMSLLPFLDIMTATMGVLVLILISVTIISVKHKSKKVYLKLKSTKEEEGRKKPTYIICEKKRMVILPGYESIHLDDLDRPDSRFYDVTNKIDRREQYIIFAVRPSGIECFKKARRLVENRDIDIGYEPVGEHWKIEMVKTMEGSL